jgi:hypothetical protein
METFLLGVGERLLHVAVQDERGSEGAVVTLTGEGSGVRLFPVRPPSSRPSEARDAGESAFPTLPQGLTEEQLESIDRLVLDTSELPGAVLVFSLEPFVRQAALHSHSPPTTVRLTLRDADAWGLKATANEL